MSSIIVSASLAMTSMTLSFIENLVRQMGGASAVEASFGLQAGSIDAFEQALNDNPIEAGCAMIAGLSAAIALGPLVAV